MPNGAVVAEPVQTSSNYTLLSVTFSSYTKTEVTDSQESGGQVIVISQTRTTKLSASISFSSPGLPEQGFVQADICDICEVEMDGDGNITSFIQHPEPSESDVMDTINSVVEDKIDSLIYSMNEQSYTLQFVADMNADPSYPKDPPYKTESPFIYPYGVEM